MPEIQFYVPPGMVAIPVSSDAICVQTVETLMGIAQRSHILTQFRFDKNYGELPEARNRLVREFMENDSLEWLFFLDADMSAPGNLVSRLHETMMATGAGIVGGFYRGGPPLHAPVAFWMDEKGLKEGIRPTEERDKRKATFTVGSFVGFPSPVDSLPRAEYVESSERGEKPFEVDGVGTGAMLIRREVFETVPDPWFVGNRGNEFIPPGSGEDFNFCIRAKRKGFSVVCDPGPEILHWKLTSVGPDAPSSPLLKYRKPPACQ